MPDAPARNKCSFCGTVYAVPGLARDCEERVCISAKEFDDTYGPPI